MAWTTPRTWVAGEFVTDTLLNVHLRDNLLAAFPNGTTPTPWTPAFAGRTSNTGQAYSSQVGRYLKVGSEVRIHGSLQLSTLGTISGDVLLAGLPFPAANVSNGFGPIVVSLWSNLTTAVVHLGGHVEPNTSQIELRKATAATASLANVVQADLSATSRLVFGGSYFTD